MPVKVTLEVIQGPLIGREFVFDETSTCILGRSIDCSPRLPDDDAHQTVSRHHCLLDINPPDIRVRDFGSRNGTYVNGARIGGRGKGMSPEQGAAMSFPEHDLKHGDQLRVGDTIFRVAVHVPARCADCFAEISEDKRSAAERRPGVFQCERCRNKAELAGRKAPPRRKPKVCARCGRDVSAEVGEDRQGEYVCTRCRANLTGVVQGILAQAKSGHRDLQMISDYTIERELGRGGMGAVYLARHEGSGERVALKVMLPAPAVALADTARDAFLREIALTKALKHRNIVRFGESGCAEGAFFFSLEYCAGGSVADLMKARGGKLPVEEAMAITRDVLDGLAYAHHARLPGVSLRNGRQIKGRGCVHRDLSPHNILLTEANNKRIAKISDYGLGKAFDTAGLSGFTRTGTTAGKPWFVPRQQVVDYKYPSPEVDVWAAAACLYNMLTGAVPRDFPGGAGADVWQIVLQTDRVPIRQRDPGIPEPLAQVIDQALIDRPAIRFKTAANLKSALQEAL